MERKAWITTRPAWGYDAIMKAPNWLLRLTPAWLLGWLPMVRFRVGAKGRERTSRLRDAWRGEDVESGRRV
jgi:hypothetical protein